MAAPTTSAAARMPASRAESLGDETETARSADFPKVCEVPIVPAVIHRLDWACRTGFLDDEILHAVSVGNLGHCCFICVRDHDRRPPGHQIVAGWIPHHYDIARRNPFLLEKSLDLWIILLALTPAGEY